METQSIKIIIVEDEAIIAERLYGDLIDFGYDVVDPCLSPEEAMEKIETEQPDLILLDINLKSDINGIQLGEWINSKFNIPFIFITANTDEATVAKAIKVKPAGFLSKPIQLKSLIGTIQVAIFNHQNNKIQTVIDATSKYYFIKSGNNYHRIDWTNVLYIESDKKHALVYEDETKAPFALRTTLEMLAQQLSTFHFVRIHKSFLVNVRHIKSFTATDVTIGSKKLAIGEVYRAGLLHYIQTLQ
jgi:two-component system, LytTR family, response regulator LytT